jgi:hypothetical protein
MSNRIECVYTAIAEARVREVHLEVVKATMTRIKAAVADLNGIAQRSPNVDAYSARCALEFIADEAEKFQDAYHVLAAQRAAEAKDKP